MPIFVLSSCSIDESSPVKLKTTVLETGNKIAFNNLFNLLIKQEDPNSFAQKTVNQINKKIESEINKPLVLEKLRIYFFDSIYNSLNKIIDIIDDEIENVPAVGQRKKAVDDLKGFINYPTDDKDITDAEKFRNIDLELNKITEIKITLEEKKGVPNQWNWKTSFKLEEGKLNNILIKNDIFYQNDISKVSNDDLKKYGENQYRYQSSKWYIDSTEQNRLTTIWQQSNLNSYSTDGTEWGFTEDDAKRSTFTIDFIQHHNSNVQYKPVFLLKTSKVISSTYINISWENYLKYKKFQDDDDEQHDKEKVKDIIIDLDSSYITYETKI